MEISAKKYEGLLYSTPLKSTSPFPSSQDCFDSCQTVFPISLIIEVEISAKKNINAVQMRWEGLEPSTSWISLCALPAKLPSLYKCLIISRKKKRLVKTNLLMKNMQYYNILSLASPA